jgi:hypothetical protein
MPGAPTLADLIIANHKKKFVLEDVHALGVRDEVFLEILDGSVGDSQGLHGGLLDTVYIYSILPTSH